MSSLPHADPPHAITPLDLDRLADELADRAATASAGRAGRTLPHPVDGLRQTLVALRSGISMDEHESPGPASLQCLRGRVRLLADGAEIPLAARQLAPIPPVRHSVTADEDAVVLLSVAAPH